MNILKVLMKLIFTDRSTKTVEEIKSVKVEEKIAAPVQKVREIKEQQTIPSNHKDEKAPIKTRVLRQKDMFSYLRRKEVKKIVSLSLQMTKRISQIQLNELWTVILTKKLQIY